MSGQSEREKFKAYYDQEGHRLPGAKGREVLCLQIWLARAALAQPAADEWTAVNALRQISSSECFDVPRMMDKDGADKELVMRMDFARRVVEMIDSRAKQPVDAVTAGGTILTGLSSNTAYEIHAEPVGWQERADAIAASLAAVLPLLQTIQAFAPPGDHDETIARAKHNLAEYRRQQGKRE